jgi:hypothetical protein
VDGVLSFDFHPYNYFLTVSFGFAVKVYGLEGCQGLTSLFAMNGQGMKQVKYSPLGNHLCILTSKNITILDAYSFTTMYVLQEKVSNFVKCTFSSNGLEFYSMNDQHHFSVHNTFDYGRLDTIRPLKGNHDFRPIQLRAFLKASQYTCVLDNGGLYVRYKAEAIVVTE